MFKSYETNINIDLPISQMDIATRALLNKNARGSPNPCVTSLIARDVLLDAGSFDLAASRFLLPIRRARDTRCAAGLSILSILNYLVCAELTDPLLICDAVEKLRNMSEHKTLLFDISTSNVLFCLN